MNIFKLETHLTKSQRSAIDGLRGFLALWVFCFHFSEVEKEAFLNTFPTVRKLFFQGYSAVPLFFCLSGFLIFVSYANLSAKFDRKVELRFFIRRIFRIWPAWLAVLCLYAAEKGISVQAFFWNFFLLFGFHPYSWKFLAVSQSWSLFPEVIFYACVPLLYGVIRKKKAFIAVFLVSLLSAGLWRAVLGPIFVPEGLQWDTPLSTFSLFLTGAAFVWILPSIPVAGKRSTGALSDLAVLSSFSALMIYNSVYLTQDYLAQLFAVALFFSVLYPSGAFHWVFSRIFDKLGVRCFSIYLTHSYAIDVALRLRARFAFLAISDKPSLDLILLFVLATLLVLGFSELLFRLVERPFQRMGQRLSILDVALFNRN